MLVNGAYFFDDYTSCVVCHDHADPVIHFDTEYLFDAFEHYPYDLRYKHFPLCEKCYNRYKNDIPALKHHVPSWVMELM